MRIEEARKVSWLYKKIDAMIFYWKRNNWLFNPKAYGVSYADVPIDRPIFLLGNQGDGLTLLSRMLRRNHDVVSVTGKSTFWAGASEMQNAFEPILPVELSGIRLKAPRHPRLTPPRGWSYASNELLNLYRNTGADANDFLCRKLRHAIGLALTWNGKGVGQPRFVDKSQVYTVKMSFIDRLLEDSNPHFVYVTRNPFASIFRSASGVPGDMKRYSKFMDFEERFQIALEHWYNSAVCIEEDRKKVGNFTQVSFENLLQHPEETLRKVCEFAGLKYSVDMVPREHHRLPLGSKSEEKWFPLRVNVNDRYLNSIPSKCIEAISEKCGDFIEAYGYERL